MQLSDALLSMTVVLLVFTDNIFTISHGTPEMLDN